MCVDANRFEVFFIAIRFDMRDYSQDYYVVCYVSVVVDITYLIDLKNVKCCVSYSYLCVCSYCSYIMLYTQRA